VQYCVPQLCTVQCTLELGQCRFFKSVSVFIFLVGFFDRFLKLGFGF